jgi:hypothetical protein
MRAVKATVGLQWPRRPQLASLVDILWHWVWPRLASNVPDGLLWPRLAYSCLGWRPLASVEIFWPPMASVDTLLPMYSGLGWHPLAFYGFSRPPLASVGLLWLQSASSGLGWHPLASLAFWPHMASLELDWVQLSFCDVGPVDPSVLIQSKSQRQQF